MGITMKDDCSYVISKEIEDFARIVAVLRFYEREHGGMPQDRRAFDSWLARAAATIAALPVTAEDYRFAVLFFDQQMVRFALRRIFEKEENRPPADFAELCAWANEHEERLKHEKFSTEDYDAAAHFCSEEGLRLAAWPAKGIA